MTRIICNLIIATIVILPLLTFANKPYILSLEIVEEAERFAYDFRLNYSLKKNSAVKKDEEIVIINIDQASLDSHGSWPWRRDKMATLIKNILDVYRAKLIVLPQSFLNRDDQSSEIIGNLRDRFYYDNAILTALEQLEFDFNFDKHLLTEMAGRPIILSYEFDNVERHLGRLPVTGDMYKIDRDGDNYEASELRTLASNWNSYKGFIGSDQEFVDSALDAGFTNLQLDADGTVRSISLGSLYAGDRYLGLPLVALRFFDNPRQPQRVVAQSHDGLFFTLPSALSALGVKEQHVGVDREGLMLLEFASTGGRENGSFEYFSAKDVMESNQRKVSLRDKVVLIGSDTEEINDLWRTPVNARFPGVEIYATALRNLRDGTLNRWHNAWLVEAFFLVVMGVLISFLYPKLRVTMTLLITIGGIVLVCYVNYVFLWVELGAFYRIVPFLTLLAMMMFTNLITGFVIEYRQKKKVEGVLNQYIPPELAKEVNTSKKGFSMEGEIREMTILFSDVRGFTSISEQFKPKELTKFMNQMLSALSHQIHLNRGTIDKYIGDAVMAFWNAPLDDARHATNAVRGAIGMQSAMRKLSEELVSKGLPELKMGVGINTGEACVGNMGSEIRLSYTVMGDSVNLASRLEGITKAYGVDIIVGEGTYELTKNDFIYRPVDAVRVKGKKQAVVIYEPICDSRGATPNDERLQKETLKYWEAYRARRFEDAVAILQSSLADYPDDGLIKLYLARATGYLQSPPGDDWEPVTNFETK